MANSSIGFSASIQAKKGRLYAVISVTENGKKKAVWRSLGLEEGAGKNKINKAYREVVSAYEDEYAAQLAEAAKTDADLPVYDYMCIFLAKVRSGIQINTYRSYHNMINSKIKNYFTKHPDLTVRNLTPKDIEDFYEYLFSFDVTANTVIHYHVVLHRAFRQAFKDELIEGNPFDRVERPKKEKFQGDHFSEEELKALLELTASDQIFPAIILAGGMGLRRSEALGVRWSRINFDEHTMLLDTKITEFDENGKKDIRIVEKMKNESSNRTLYIPDQVYEILLDVRERQNINRKMFKGNYNRTYDDFVCTDALGEILRPGYVTQHFTDLLKKIGMRHIRFHDLRHTFASVLLNKDVPLINVSKFLGHSTISTTANIYAHLDKSNKQATADVMNSILSGKPNENGAS